MSLDQQAMIAPTKTPGYHPYNCHMAVLQWACLANGQSEKVSIDSVERITRHVCPHCKHQSLLKGSLQNDEYGKIFCAGATPLNNMSARAGDVVIVPNKGRPMHSMVIVSADRGQLLVRGYNNAGTFVGAPRDAYDTTSRNLANRNAPHDNPVFLIPQATYLGKLRPVLQMLGLKAMFAQPK